MKLCYHYRRLIRTIENWIFHDRFDRAPEKSGHISMTVLITKEW